MDSIPAELTRLLATLNPREENVLRRYYGMGQRKQTVRAIAAHIQRTPATVHRLRHQALRTLTNTKRFAIMYALDRIYHVTQDGHPYWEFDDYARAIHQLHTFVPRWRGYDTCDYNTAQACEAEVKRELGRTIASFLTTPQEMKRMLGLTPGQEEEG